MPDPQTPGTRPLGWLNFFLADVQTGVGPFLAAYLAGTGWNPRDVGYALTFGGLVTVALSPFAGAAVDASRNKRSLVAAATLALVASALSIGLGTGLSTTQGGLLVHHL